ncbi:MAG: sensor histidine kinase [Solirubrobacteraceae bacterium]
MTLRKRVSWIAGASVGIAILLAAVVCYAVVRSQLRGQVDSALIAQQQADVASQRVVGQSVPSIPASAGGPAQYTQIVPSDGSPEPVQGSPGLPVPGECGRIADAGSGSLLVDIDIGHSQLRLLCFGATLEAFPGGPSVPGAVELARPLNGVNRILSTLRLVLLLLIAGGVILAVALGRIASKRVLAPLAEVAQAAQHIGETDDLTQRLRVYDADDEVGQLATRFNHMLDRLESSRAALDDSVRAQRQLVADASHELRTPVTSLRTNIEVLLASDDLQADDRRRLLADVVEQSEELTALVSDLIELARGDQPGPATEDVRLDSIAAESLDRARRNDPQLEFTGEIEPVAIAGVPERLARAINNLLDNAARHTPAGGTVRLTVVPGEVVVRDHGAGVDPDDQPYVFDRFFRGRNSRGRHGSGLGLAIVRQVTEQHGGTVSVANALDGGAVFTLHLPDAAAPGPLAGPLAHVADAASRT